MRRPRVIAAAALVFCALGAGASAIELGDNPWADGLGEQGALPALAGMLGLEQRELERGQQELRPPDNAALLLTSHGPYFGPEVRGSALRAHAFEYDSRVFSRPHKRPRAMGLARRGSVLRVSGRASGPGCAKGAWYTLEGGGFVCTRDGFAVSRKERDKSFRQVAPKVDQAMPFEYGKVNTREALRYYSIPDAAEERAIAEALEQERRLPDVVDMQLEGDYLVAIDRLEGEGEFYRTIRGRYLRREHIDPKPEPAFQGQLLNEEMHLPLAFVFGELPGTPVLRRGSEGVEDVGIAHVHSRFVVQDIEHWGDRGEVVVGPDSLGVARERVRLARRRSPPEEVEPGGKWIHVDLDEQTLVAYQGERPVFATLVSSGKEGYDTPVGLFRIHEKHLTVTMRGEDPVDGPYEVSEVPWTMYYWKSYALHGAYWHNTYGNVRSHGCTNLSPIDARWLFHFTADEVPAGWHARRRLKRGTWVQFTRDSKDEDGAEADS